MHAAAVFLSKATVLLCCVAVTAWRQRRRALASPPVSGADLRRLHQERQAAWAQCRSMQAADRSAADVLAAYCLYRSYDRRITDAVFVMEIQEAAAAK